MRKINVLAALLLSTGMVLATATALTSNEKYLVNAAEKVCQHAGNHYTQKDPTESEHGIKEYWVCCSCHEHYLSRPDGTWYDAGVANVEIDSTDDRYIACSQDLYDLGFTSVTKNEDGTYTVGKYTSDSKTCIIPEGVTVINRGTFRSCSLDWLVIPASVTTMYSSAFKGVNTIYFVGDTSKTADWLGCKQIYKIQGIGWNYVNGIPTIK